MRLDDDLKYFEEPEFKEILAKYEAARDRGDTIYMDADDLTDIAEYYSIVIHDEVRAEEAIQIALLIHPDAVDPQIFRARQAMLRGDIEEADKLCKEIKQQDHREVMFLHAELLVREELLEEASQYLHDHATQIYEDRDFFLYDAAYIFIDYRCFDWALSFANELAEMAPDWYKTWELQADVQLGLENYKLALGYVERMLDVDPFSIEAWNWSAEAHCGNSHYDEALDSLEYALAIDPANERALQLKAWILLQQGNYEEAHTLYQHAIEQTPEVEQNWLYDSYCLLDTERPEQALSAIEQAEALSKGMSEDQETIYEQHAQILSRLGREEEAIHYVDLAQQLGSGETTAVDFDLFRARINAENDHFQQAITFVRKACDESDDEHRLQTCFHAGQILFDTAYYDSAMDIFTDLLEHTTGPSQADCHAYLAFCAMELHDDEGVLRHLRAAMPDAQDRLQDLFGDEFPGVTPAEYFDYYYYRVNGHFPAAE